MTHPNTNKKQCDKLSDEFEDAAFLAALEIDQMEMEIQHLQILQPTQDSPTPQQKVFCGSSQYGAARYQDKVERCDVKQQPNYYVVEVLKNGLGSTCSKSKICANGLKELVERKFRSFTKAAESPISPQNYNMHMLHRYITEMYPGLYPKVLQTCGSGLKISFLLGMQPQKLQKNRLIIDIRDQNVSSLIGKLERMFLGVVECVDFPSFFGIAFITKNTYRYDQTCHLKFQYCNGNIGSANYKLFKNSKFNILTICDSNDRWPLICCYSLAGINPRQNALMNFVFPNSEEEKKVVLEIQSRYNFYLADLTEQQHAAVSAIVTRVASPLPFVLLAQNDEEIGDVVVECVVQLLDAGNICLVVCSQFNAETLEIIEDVRHISQHAQNVNTLEQFSDSLDIVKPSSALFVEKLEASEVCWNDKRIHFHHVIFLHMDEMEEEFVFTMLAGIQSFVQQHELENDSHVTFCGKYPCTEYGILSRLLQCSMYRSDVAVSTCNEVLQPRTDLFRQEKFPGWICDLWQEYVTQNGGNPNYICRL
eukprot:TRINITY_DN6558_c0_g1_i1.p1 TRINITY_DN6558_c0_g1~~TRINITY_DN6558_c0_g1_i1.p1  ORF type:complete len:555 (+),score=56.58 TRINITY_DN6558_c0_g1_i1:62-1666(+)